MRRVVIIGAGIGGLASALLLANAGLEVVVCEAGATPGGKLRHAVAGGVRIDAGPTVLTMLPVFQAIFASAGARLEDYVAVERLDVLARHAWEGVRSLDLFDDTSRNVAAIGEFAGAKAALGYKAFAARSKKIYEILEGSFMQIAQPGLAGLVLRSGVSLMNISPFATLWGELGTYFANPRLRQLFGRYATYCGSSPFNAPATLMLIAHAEQRGVWRVQGGMFALARAFEAAAQARGVQFLYNAPVQDILIASGRACGVKLNNGEVLPADAVVANTELGALAGGLLGATAQQAVAGSMKGAVRSYSAKTWAMTGSISGNFQPAHHNVFFSEDYPAEFAQLAAGQMPADPTVYLCAPEPGAFFALINAPANGDAPQVEAFPPCLTKVMKKLQACGLRLTPTAVTAAQPRQFATMFPGSGGALYGRALTGWRDSFARPGTGTKLPGLFLAGGSVHPGPGLPMAAISGRLAASAVMDFCARSRTVVMPGGISTPSAMTGGRRAQL
jgi:1-hydroxycarotenoid 3,4-desaturase